MMRKTKVICTLGPSVDNEETLRKLILAGMNCARFNFSHGTHESHLATDQAQASPGRAWGLRWPPCWTPRGLKSVSRALRTGPSP